MGQTSLADAAVRGVSNPFKLSDEQKNTLLEEGDIEGLLEYHSLRFGSAVMEDDEDEDDESEDDEDDDTEDGDDDEDEDDESGDDDDDADKSKKGKKPDAKDTRIQQLVAESKKYRLKNRAHRTRIAELEAQLAAKQPKGKSKKDEDDEEDSSANSEELRTTKTENDRLARTNEDLLIRLEFMANTKHKWKNPKAALKLLDLSDVEIDEDGEIDGLEEAIDALAESDPYLLDKGTEEKKDKQRRRNGATGQATGTKQSRKGNPNRDKLLSKYPALRR